MYGEGREEGRESDCGKVETRVSVSWGWSVEARGEVWCSRNRSKKGRWCRNEG